MKKRFLLLSLTLPSLFSQAQTIIQYGKYNVSKDEFLRAYNKNKVASSNKEKSVRDYVELYTNFKLKVKAAEEMHLDTAYQLQTDYDNFRRQIETNYLNDEAALQKLMNEALQRSRSDLHLMLYSVNFKPEDPADDTLNKYQTLQKLQKDFSGNASAYVPQEVKQNDLGFITVFSLPYVYESMAYALKKDESSALFRNKKGWHFLRLIDQRPAMGKWKMAQILLSYPPDADMQTKGLVQKRADSIYQLLKSGADFAAMARALSEDRLTANNGGEIPEFGTGKYDPSFENEVARLKKDGDMSAPFYTHFGVHIIKRISYTPAPDSIKDETLQYEIKQKLMQDSRLSVSRDHFAKEIMKKVGYKLMPGLKKEDFLKYADTVMDNPDEELVSKLPVSDKIIIQFAKGNVKGKNWLQFVRDVKTGLDENKDLSNEALWEKYQSSASVDYYRKHLEEYSSDFAYQLKEFSEGNMLFEIMEKRVWSKAANDSAGLLKYYEAHKDQYKWSESADVLVFNCNTPAVANQVREMLEQGVNWKKLVEMKQDEVQGDSGRFELSQINLKYISDKMLGRFSDVTVNQDGTASIMRYLEFHPKDEQKSFESAKGIVINDYQTQLEKNWLEELRKKYPVKVNEVVVKSIIN